MSGSNRKLGVRPETHEAFGRVADATGWSVSRSVDFALEALIKARRLKIPFISRRERPARRRKSAA